MISTLEGAEGEKAEGPAMGGSDKPTPTVQQSSMENQFRIQEFIELRREIQSSTEETRKLERFCLIGVAAIYSWISTQATPLINQSNIYIAVLVPPLLVLFGWLKGGAIESHILDIGKYIAELEKRILPPDEGWEKYYASSKSRQWILPEFVSGKFWPLLFAASCGISLFLIKAQILSLLKVGLGCGLT